MPWGVAQGMNSLWSLGSFFFLDEITAPSLETNCHVNQSYLVLLILQPPRKKRMVWALSLH